MELGTFEVSAGGGKSFDRLCYGCGEKIADGMIRLKYPAAANTLSDYRDVIFCSPCWQKIWSAFGALGVRIDILERRSNEGRRGTDGNS